MCLDGLISTFLQKFSLILLKQKINPSSHYFTGILFFLLWAVFYPLGAQDSKKKEKGSLEIRGFEYVEKNKFGNEVYRHLGYKKNNIWVELGTGMRFVLIQKVGSFQMGTETPKKANPTPEEVKWSLVEKAHQVTLTKPFLISETEVTQEVYEKIMRESPWTEVGIQEVPDFPATRLLWDDILKFCRRTGTQLPTEAQWEYTARAGTTTYYYWGDEANPLYVWSKENSTNHTLHKVATKNPNPFGLYDMSGNAWEVCQDWFANYSQAEDIDPTGPETGEERVIRGGSSHSSVAECRSASRQARALKTHWNNEHVGFRLVRNLF